MTTRSLGRQKMIPWQDAARVKCAYYNYKSGKLKKQPSFAQSIACLNTYSTLVYQIDNEPITYSNGKNPIKRASVSLSKIQRWWLLEEFQSFEIFIKHMHPVIPRPVVHP